MPHATPFGAARLIGGAERGEELLVFRVVVLGILLVRVIRLVGGVLGVVFEILDIVIVIVIDIDIVIVAV